MSNSKSQNVNKQSDISRLVLGRKTGESLKLQTSDGDIVIQFLKTEGNLFRVAIDAPRSVQILRLEVEDKNTDA